MKLMSSSYTSIDISNIVSSHCLPFILLVFLDDSENVKMGSYSDFFGAVSCAKYASLAFGPCDDMISLTLRALFGILGGVLLLCLSLLSYLIPLVLMVFVQDHEPGVVVGNQMANPAPFREVPGLRFGFAVVLA